MAVRTRRLGADALSGRAILGLLAALIGGAEDMNTEEHSHC
ncbi:MAG: hypothetical protein ACKO1L_07000 [Brachymonas sp.]